MIKLEQILTNSERQHLQNRNHYLLEKNVKDLTLSELADVALPMLMCVYGVSEIPNTIPCLYAAETLYRRAYNHCVESGDSIF